MRTSEHYTADLLAYFEGHDREHALYLALVSALEQTLPENFSVRVQKSQISFYGRHLFGAASIPVRRKKDWPPDCLMVTFGLEHRADSPRIAVATEPYPNRWTTICCSPTRQRSTGSCWTGFRRPTGLLRISADPQKKKPAAQASFYYASNQSGGRPSSSRS